MTITNPRAKFIRGRVTPNAKRGLFLSDLDTPDIRRSQRDKIPVYIPLGESWTDIPLTDRTLLSYLEGSIRGFLEQGLLEAYILEGDGVEVNEIAQDTGLLRVDTSAGPSLITLPGGLPVGTQIALRKTSLDLNVASVVAGSGDTLEGGSTSLTAFGDARVLKLDETRQWRLLNASSGGGGGSVISVTGNLVDNTDPANPVVNQSVSTDTASIGSDGLLYVPASSLTVVFTNTDIAPLYNTCVVATPPAFGLNVFLPDSNDLPGGVIEVVKVTADASPVFIASNVGETVLGSTILTAPYEVAGWRALGGLWVRIY